jgi:carboxypeptidase Q
LETFTLYFSSKGSFMKKRIAAVSAICLLCPWVLIAGEKIHSDINWRICREATEHSQILRTVHQLTDIFGPRLTGSPNFKASCEWSAERLKEWGMKNVQLEKWNFGHPGWTCDKYSVHVVSPYKANLHARVVAWTPATKGVIRAKVVQINPPEIPSEKDLAAYLNKIKNSIRGRIVLVGAHTHVPIKWNPHAKRLEDSELLRRFDPLNPEAPEPDQVPRQPGKDPKLLSPQEVEDKICAFLLAEGALVQVADAALEHGLIRVFANRTYNLSKSVPSIVISNDDYGRLSRVLADGVPVEMEIEIVNSTSSDTLTSLNVTAEIPGTGRKDQVVMLGAHIDSWHAGTGATDNATGVAVMMEAARILGKIDAKPKRTIRLALWGGEEQGLLGSRAYIREHFGTFEAPKPEFPALCAYVNIDYGTGRIRGASVFGPPEAAEVLRQILAPFRDLGVMGANALNARTYGATDSTAFNWAGLSGINLIQDPIEYIPHSWHSDLDTYERVLEEDLKQCATVIASLVYHLAAREEMIPRFSDESMPPPQ